MKDASPVEDLAREHLAYIRRTLEVSTRFTAVPGWGGVGMGCLGLLAGGLSFLPVVEHRELWVWAAAAPLGFLVAWMAMVRKAARVGLSLFRGPGQRFLLGLLPPLAVGAVLSAAALRAGADFLLPGIWLLLYGTAVLAAGAFSVRIVPVLGVAFLALGVVALFTPPAWGTLWLTLGFGGLNLVFGLVIARRHGG